MANLGGTFDANNVEPSAPRDLIPPGKYLAHIIDSELKDTQAGGQMLALTIEILEGPHEKRRLWDNLNLVNRNDKAVEIAQRTLSAICHATGRLQVADSEDLHFRPMVVTVEVEVRKEDKDLPADDPARRYNSRVKGYAAPDGAKPQPRAAAPATAAPARPAPVAAAPAAKAAPPWRR
jgi:hypothetical protein